jgi:type III secretion protein R
VPDLTLVVVLLGFVPFALLATTSFAKLSIVLSLLRNALGPSDVPPGSVVLVLAALLTGYVMLPVAREVASASAPALARVEPNAPWSLRADNVRALTGALEAGKEPLRAFLDRNSGGGERGTFLGLLRQRTPEAQQGALSEHDFAVVLPAFFVTELKEALQLGFLLLLPFFVLDLVIASLLAALGMQGLPASSVALPFKLLLFVSVDGFRTLVEALVTGYR